jgi:recombination protein RecT
MKANGTDAVVAINKTAEPQRPKTLKQFLLDNKSSFEAALPKNTINVERFITAAAMEITNNPKLMQCDHTSIILSLGQAARYGLETGPLLGQAWLIPYNENRYIDGKWLKQMVCHFQIGYRGLIVLARRSQTIKTISAEIVYENDFIEVELGLKHSLTHKIDIRKERGEPIAYYCIVELVNGGVQFGIISKVDAEKHRDKYSKSYAKKKEGEESVWDTNFDEMALKTIVIKVLKLCPLSIEALEAVSRAEREDMIDVTNDDYTIGVKQEPKNTTPKPSELPKNSPTPPENNINKEPKEEDNEIIPGVTIITERPDDQNDINDTDPAPQDVPDELDIF